MSKINDAQLMALIINTKVKPDLTPKERPRASGPVTDKHIGRLVKWSGTFESKHDYRRKRGDHYENR